MPRKKDSFDSDHEENFFSLRNHHDKIEDCRIYDKEGNLIKKVSPKEQLDKKWKDMNLAPLKYSPHPSTETPEKKRKRGEHLKREHIAYTNRLGFDFRTSETSN